MNFSRKKKEHRERRSPISTLKSKHTIVSSIFLVIIILTTIATPCFAVENSISWTEDEQAFIKAHQVIQDVVNIVSYKIDEQEIGFRLSKDPPLLFPIGFSATLSALNRY